MFAVTNAANDSLNYSKTGLEIEYFWQEITICSNNLAEKGQGRSLKSTLS